jgi:HlyD family secretion protein
MVMSAQNKSIFSRYKWWIISAVLLVILALLTFLNRSKPPEVALVRVERGTVEASVSNNRAGTVKACRRAKMSPPAGGQISKLNVKKGQRVVAGQVLLELWHKDLRAQEELAQEQSKTVASRVKEICALSEAAQRDAERSVQLKEQGFISAQILDKSLTEARARQASCEAAKGEVLQSGARIDVARAGLERMILRAPFAGIVADISGELGEFATPSPPGILTLPAIDLIDDSCMYVSAPIDEVDAAVVKVGQFGKITLDALKGKQFAGKVQRISPYVIELEKQSRTVEVEVAFSILENGKVKEISPEIKSNSGRSTPPGEASNTQGQAETRGGDITQRDVKVAEENLLVGYSADIEIVHKVRENVLRIPTQHLMEGKKVLVYKPDGRLEERVVTTGLANWQYTEIVSGLQEGEQIVATLDRVGIKAGAKVTPEPVAKEGAKPAL